MMCSTIVRFEKGQGAAGCMYRRYGTLTRGGYAFVCHFRGFVLQSCRRGSVQAHFSKAVQGLRTYS